MTDTTAVDISSLPEGSVIAVGREIAVLRTVHPGTPWEERVWIGAQTYALGNTDRMMQSTIDHSDLATVQILRHGYVRTGRQALADVLNAVIDRLDPLGPDTIGRDWAIAQVRDLALNLGVDL